MKHINITLCVILTCFVVQIGCGQIVVFLMLVCSVLKNRSDLIDLIDVISVCLCSICNFFSVDPLKQKLALANSFHRVKMTHAFVDSDGTHWCFIKIQNRKTWHNKLSWECLFVGWLLNVPATCECISGTDLHRQFYVLPH